MLTWANDHESFGNFPSVDTLLENKTKDELISIIKEMFERVPELINILERSEAIKSSRKNPVTPEIYRRQIREAMEYTDNWHNRFAGANEITSIVAIEDRFADNDDFENAFIVYQAVIGETLENYYMVHDEGEITEEIDSAIEGISFCLSKQKESGNRIEMLKALFEVKK